MKARLAAAGLHLLGSVLVIFFALSAIYFIWYPKPFYTLYSVIDAVKVVLSVDLVLGPFLTLVIYNNLKARKVLIRDISIILILQIAALGWGLHITYKMRPLFFVFHEDTFYPISKEDINLKKLNKNVTAPTIWQTLKTVYIEPIRGKDAIQRMKAMSLGGEIKGEMYKPEMYKPLILMEDNVYRQAIIQKAISTTHLFKSLTWKQGVEQILLAHKGEINDYLFYPIDNDVLFQGLIVYKRKDFSFVGLVENTY